MSEDPSKEISSLVKKIDSAIFWYDDFEEWFQTRFYSRDMEFGEHSMIRWDARIKLFFFFDEKEGFYREVDEERLHNILFRWAGAYGFEISPSKLTIVMKRLKAFLFIDHDKWNERFYKKDKEIENDSVDKFFDLNNEVFE